MDLTVGQDKAPAQPLHPYPCTQGWGRSHGPRPSHFTWVLWHTLPACRLMGFLWPGPRSAAAGGKLAWERSPAHPASPAWAPCIFNNVHYSCFVTGKETEQLRRSQEQQESRAVGVLHTPALPRPPVALPLSASQHWAIPQVCYHPPIPGGAPSPCLQKQQEPNRSHCRASQGVGHSPGAEPCRSPTPPLPCSKPRLHPLTAAPN